ncbi:hypothetical protein CEUSTIGMA_g7656.t1 [Chlamydomonas eustigma]|uniref:Uncharacterized protein n=1 Tax=Chlamydomonas eustigma TaxID=1157962 RepID=A0A250XAV7_9CHLO|nr:hypothetical protein CEUSTIGMA_g7656.t1 [Chlamydomonas eustigma]|eukprot:GAX80218.1 hypothetical protein CEUSTIGMA_g7656.t1 [Chlamydomonas eustigma]
MTSVATRPVMTACAANDMSYELPGSSQFGSSLVFQMENNEDFSEQDCNHKLAEHVKNVKDRVSAFASPSSSFASRLISDVSSFRRVLLREGSELDTVELASKLSSFGYSVSVRSALGGGNSCFRNLRHDFLLVRGTDEFEGIECIVDLHFKEQFEIPHPTEAYLEILACVPEDFVGPLSRLMPLVQTLSSEMAESFTAKGLTLPPWRRTQSMLSKWVPAKSRDVEFARGSCDSMTSPSGVSAAEGMSPTSVIMECRMLNGTVKRAANNDRAEVLEGYQTQFLGMPTVPLHGMPILQLTPVLHQGSLFHRPQQQLNIPRSLSGSSVGASGEHGSSTMNAYKVHVGFEVGAAHETSSP